MSTSTASAEQDRGYGRPLTLLKEHFVWVSPVAVGLAFLAGLLNLLAFTWFIGRPELFSLSLEFGPSLALLMLSYLAIFAAIVASMLVTSLVFIATLQQLRPKPNFSRSMTCWLFGMVVCGMSTLLALVIVLAYSQKETPSNWWVFTVLIGPALISWFFLRKHKNPAAVLASPLSRAKIFCLCTIASGFVALLGILPARYTLALYGESVGLDVLNEIALLFVTCLIVMAGSLVPALGYYVNAKKGRAAQIKGALIGLMGFLALLTFAMPAIFNVASVSSIRLLGFSEREVRRYLVDSEQYPVSSFNATRWSVTEHGDKRHSLIAFSLYAYGPVNLLCPEELSTLKNWELRQHTKVCIPFERAEIRTLDAAEPDAELASIE
ncbi:hypothetical protein [Halopseudomonas pelagia]|uniref:hypothetical protein n=1 Tax=Halopseudomonas pelagia TaxID=553151 RepID=UPI00039B93E2|nr:hypothetical protein [Halopseudomonas pelagia]